MKEFPDKLIPVNHTQFKRFRYDRNILYFRQDIYEFMLEDNENEAYDLNAFKIKYKVSDDEMKTMVIAITTELKKLGWQHKLAFADTGLFIYRDANKPPKRVVDAI